MSADVKADWLTTDDLAAEMDRPRDWIQKMMAAGEIPSVKIGRRRYFTPECRAELMRRQLGEPDAGETAEVVPETAEVVPVDGWDRAGARGQRAS